MTSVHMGILMRRWPSPERPFGTMTRFAQTVFSLAQAEGVKVSAFSPEDLDLSQGRVHSYRYRGDRMGWSREDVPLPPVVWSRYFGRDQPGVLQELQTHGVTLLNEMNLNKWDAYLCLDENPELRRFLPETRQLTSALTVAEMLERHRVVFLKPISGSVGRGIIRATRRGQGIMRLKYISTVTSELRSVYVSHQQLDRWLKRKRQAGRYIAQQGLSLAVYDGRPADVRVLVQKDRTGRWRVTGMGARVAAPGRFTSNLHTGGEAVPVELLLQAALPGDESRQQTVLSELEPVALRLVSQIESGSGSLGEVGLDLAVDRDGKIWYIEQNTQPGRAIFEALSRWDLSDLAHLRPVQYARFLCLQKTTQEAGGAST